MILALYWSKYGLSFNAVRKAWYVQKGGYGYCDEDKKVARNSVTRLGPHPLN